MDDADAIYKTKVAQGWKECADDSKCVTAFRNSLRFTIALLLYLFHFVPFLCFGFFLSDDKAQHEREELVCISFLFQFFSFLQH